MSDAQHIKLSDITTIRVHCLGCNGVVEVPVERLEAVFLECCCPLCRQAYYKDKEEAELLPWFGKAIGRLKTVKAAVEIEIVLPANPAGGGQPQ